MIRSWGLTRMQQARRLFETSNPAHLLEQTDKPVLKPELPYEKTGQYAAGTTFAEGLVFFHGKWFLYYGCADSLVAVAMAPAQAMTAEGAADDSGNRDSIAPQLREGRCGATGC